MLSNPASRRVCTARRTSSGAARRSSTASRCGRKLCAPSDTRFTPPARSSSASSGVTVSGFASTVSSSAAGQRREQSRELRSLGERRSAAAEEDGLDALREHVPLERELGEQRVDVRRVLPAPPDHRHEVAVPAAVRAERQVHVEVPDAAHLLPLLVEVEHGEEGLLRDLHPADLLHPLLALLLLLEQLPLARDVAAVALREHVLPPRLDRLARDHARADRGLHGHVEHLPRDLLPQPLDELLAAVVRVRRDGR